VRPLAAIRRGADGRKTRANQNDEEGQGTVYAPLAIGSHRSCSLTSNSYPSPCACASSVRSMGWSSSGDWTGATPSALCGCSGVDDMLADSRLDGACALAACAVIRWRPRHTGEDAMAWRPGLQPRCNGNDVWRGMRLAACRRAAWDAATQRTLGMGMGALRRASAGLLATQGRARCANGRRVAVAAQVRFAACATVLGSYDSGLRGAVGLHAGVRLAPRESRE
jgi:hypothetical protein